MSDRPIPVAEPLYLYAKGSDDDRRIKALRRRVDKARQFPTNTDPYSRHLHMIADHLSRGKSYPMLYEEPQHCAESMLATLASLWEARTKDGNDADRWRYLQSIDHVKAQAFFWNYRSRKQREAAIDTARTEDAARTLVESSQASERGRAAETAPAE